MCTAPAGIGGGRLVEPGDYRPLDTRCTPAAREATLGHNRSAEAIQPQVEPLRGFYASPDHLFLNSLNSASL